MKVMKNAQICFVFICLRNSDLHSEQARTPVKCLPVLFSGLTWGWGICLLLLALIPVRLTNVFVPTPGNLPLSKNRMPMPLGLARGEAWAPLELTVASSLHFQF